MSTRYLEATFQEDHGVQHQAREDKPWDETAERIGAAIRERMERGELNPRRIRNGDNDEFIPGDAPPDVVIEEMENAIYNEQEPIRPRKAGKKNGAPAAEEQGLREESPEEDSEGEFEEENEETQESDGSESDAEPSDIEARFQAMLEARDEANNKVIQGLLTELHSLRTQAQQPRQPAQAPDFEPIRQRLEAANTPGGEIGLAEALFNMQNQFSAQIGQLNQAVSQIAQARNAETFSNAFQRELRARIGNGRLDNFDQIAEDGAMLAVARGIRDPAQAAKLVYERIAKPLIKQPVSKKSESPKPSGKDQRGVRLAGARGMGATERGKTENGKTTIRLKRARTTEAAERNVRALEALWNR